MSVSGSNGLVVFLETPHVELICGCLLLYSMFRARTVGQRNKDEKKSHGWVNLMLVRGLAFSYCLSFSLMWILWFPVKGAIMPLSNPAQVSANRGLQILFFSATFMKFGALPATGLAWTFFMLDLHASMMRRPGVPIWVEVVAWVGFLAASIIRLIYGIQWVDKVHYFDNCMVPFTCMTLWTVTGVACILLINKIHSGLKAVAGSLKQSRIDRQVSLMKKLAWMVFTCALAIIGRAVQVTHCAFVRGTTDKIVFQLFKRCAVIGILMMAVVVTWVPPDGKKRLLASKTSTHAVSHGSTSRPGTQDYTGTGTAGTGTSRDTNDAEDTQAEEVTVTVTQPANERDVSVQTDTRAREIESEMMQR